MLCVRSPAYVCKITVFCTSTPCPRRFVSKVGFQPRGRGASSCYTACMTRAKAIEILDKMKKLFPDAPVTELTNWETDFQLLVAIILSAQMTDKGVNKVTKALFAKYPTPTAMTSADHREIYDLIPSINFAPTKAKYLLGTAKTIVEKYRGQVPQTVAELMILPGVGEKTAKVFLSSFYGYNVGIGSDTHVLRVAKRLGLTQETTPSKVSADLEKIYPKNRWHEVNQYFVLYGRYICTAKAPVPNDKCVFEFCSYCHPGYDKHD